jgi:uncharacterized caspase-like protein
MHRTSGPVVLQPHASEETQLYRGGGTQHNTHITTQYNTTQNNTTQPKEHNTTQEQYSTAQHNTTHVPQMFNFHLTKGL